MTQKQALFISIIAGLVALSFVVIIALLLIPSDQLLPASTPPPTFAPLPTPTPTFPNFMPTPSLETALPAAPTPTNTPVLLVTPTRPPSPTPTTDFDLAILTPFVRPTPTLTPTLPPPPTEPLPTATLPSARQYSISFRAENALVEEGDCTNLKWDVQGAVANIQLNGQSVATSGLRKVCPQGNTTYILSIQLEGSARIERRTVTVSVK